MHVIPCLRGDDLSLLSHKERISLAVRAAPGKLDRWLAADALPLPRAIPAPCPPDCVRVEGPLNNFYRLANGVYRGGRPSGEAAFRVLHKLGVRTILNLEDCTSTNKKNREYERKHARRHGMHMIHKPISPIFSLRYKTVMDVVRVLQDPDRRPVYVHCLFGHERTGFVIALNRFFNEGWSYDEARSEMMKCGFRRWLTPAMYHNFRRWCEKNPHKREPKEE